MHPVFTCVGRSGSRGTRPRARQALYARPTKTLPFQHYPSVVCRHQCYIIMSPRAANHIGPFDCMCLHHPNRWPSLLHNSKTAPGRAQKQKKKKMQPFLQYFKICGPDDDKVSFHCLIWMEENSLLPAHDRSSFCSVGTYCVIMLFLRISSAVPMRNVERKEANHSGAA
jgi:hypothetical protein